MSFQALRDLLLRARSDRKLYEDLYRSKKVWTVANLKQDGPKLHFNIEKRSTAAYCNSNSGGGESKKNRKSMYVMVARFVGAGATSGNSDDENRESPSSCVGSITCRVASSKMEPFFDLSPVRASLNLL